MALLKIIKVLTFRVRARSGFATKHHLVSKIVEDNDSIVFSP